MLTLFTTISISLGLPPGLLSSLCYVESKHKINAIHHDDGTEDSLGICQIQYTTAKQLGFKGTKEQLMDPKNNIKYAGLYLKHQISRYNSVQKGVIAYNQGHCGTIRTTKYQRNVYRRWHVQTGR
jgi:soluble lytic murein transglycosylase-like protein